MPLSSTDTEEEDIGHTERSVLLPLNQKPRVTLPQMMKTSRTWCARFLGALAGVAITIAGLWFVLITVSYVFRSSGCHSVYSMRAIFFLCSCHCLLYSMCCNISLDAWSR